MDVIGSNDISSKISDIFYSNNFSANPVSYLTEEYGRGFSRSNVAGMRQFYMAYKDREDEIIQSGIGQFEQAFGIVQSGIGQLETAYKKIPFKLSWTHYQILMRIEDKDERD